MKSLIHSKKFIYILLTLIIFAGIVRFSYGFFVEKKERIPTKNGVLVLQIAIMNLIFILRTMIYTLKIVTNGLKDKY